MRASRLLPAIGLLSCLAFPIDAASESRKTKAVDVPQVAASVERALDERRYADARNQLESAMVRGAQDPRLDLLSGELELKRQRPATALADFRRAFRDPADKGAALQGQGIALALLGRSEEARGVLKSAVKAKPTAWRAWSALAALYDDQGDWKQAEEAYRNAIETSNSAPIVLNNRGYSYLLQRRLTEAATDFVAALKQQPDLAEARTNLRVTLAMQGDYATAMASGSPSDQASLLNNAGFAAGLRGDYAQAEKLLTQAMETRGQFYDRASENLAIIRSLAAQAATEPVAPRKP
jgi:Flp pilus assembly protein TadD